MINDLIKKLRKAADALDDLLDIVPSHNGKAKQSIEKKIESAFKKKKKHWTQTKAGKAKMSAQIKKMWAKKKGNVKAVGYDS